MIGSVNDSSPPVLVETEAAALFITGVVARGSAMGMVVTSLSPVDGGKSGVRQKDDDPLDTKKKWKRVLFPPKNCLEFPSPSLCWHAPWSAPRASGSREWTSKAG